MRKLFLILWISLALVPTKILSGEPDKILHKKCIYPTVLIFQEFGHGSGVIVKSEKTDYGYINVALTCAHVVKDKYNGKWHAQVCTEFEDWSTIKKAEARDCKVYAVNHAKDLAIVTFVTDKQMHVAEFGFDEKLYIGNEIFGLGCALMQPPRLDYGKVTSFNTPDGYRSSLRAIPGDSGGPVYHKYYLVGIKKAISMTRVGTIISPLFELSFFIPIKELLNWDKDTDGMLEFVYKESVSVPELEKLSSKYVVDAKYKQLMW